MHRTGFDGRIHDAAITRFYDFDINFGVQTSKPILFRATVQESKS